MKKAHNKKNALCKIRVHYKILNTSELLKKCKSEAHYVWQTFQCNVKLYLPH